MGLQRYRTYVKDVTEFLDNCKLDFDFGTCQETVWDAVLERYYERYSGPMSDYVDREREYMAEAARPGGDYRESFEEWFSGSEHADKLRDGEETVQELYELFAQERMDQSLECYFSKADKKRSKYGTPDLLDHIEDIDDNIDVAWNFNIVPFDKRRLGRLSRIYKARGEKDYLTMVHYFIGRGLMQKLHAVKWKDSSYEMRSEKTGVCWECDRPVMAEECVRTELGEFRVGVQCESCDNLVSWRSCLAYKHYLMGNLGLRKLALRNVPDLFPKLCFESSAPTPTLLHRLQQRRRRFDTVYDIAAQLAEYPGIFMSNTNRPGQNVTLSIELPHDSDYRVPVSFFASGEACVGSLIEGDSVLERLPDESQLDYVCSRIRPLLKEAGEQADREERKKKEVARAS